MLGELSRISKLFLITGRTDDGSLRQCAVPLLRGKPDRINALYHDKTGFVLLYMRLDSGRFHWFRSALEGRLLTRQEYRWLMEGLSVDQTGRGGRHPQEFLEGFSGMLQCDGYQGYNKIDDVILACCLVHCRRKFYEAVPAKRRKSWKLLDINSNEIKEYK